MFKNRILVRVEPPASLSSSPFLLVQLSLTSHPSSVRSIELETLCCKLSRSRRLACFHQSSDIFVIYQRSQSDSAAQVVKELAEALPIGNVGAEEEVKAVSLIARAVECGLRTVMLDNNWRSVGDYTFVDTTFEGSDEGNHLNAVNLRVQSEMDNHLVFLVSPDVIRFKTFKILDLVSSKMLQNFENGKVIALDANDFSTNCSILPHLYEGHVIGVSKLLPSGENFERSEKLWSLKYGLALPGDYYIDVQLNYEGHVNKQWFPSSFVLQGSGLVPAPQTVRTLKAAHALESFIKIAGAWDFFDQGPLKVKEISSLGIGTSLSVWKTAADNLVDHEILVNNSIPDTCETISETNLISKDLLLTLDFRTPKPYFGPVFRKRTYEHTAIQENAISSSNTSLGISSNCIGNMDNISSNDKFRPVVLELAPITQRTSSVPGKGIWASSKPGCAESLCVNDSSATEEKYTSADACMPIVNLQESASTQMDIGNLQCSFKASRTKEKAEAFLDNSSLVDPVKVPLVKTLGKRTMSTETKSKDVTVEGCKKVKAKHCVDQSDITTKVTDCYTRRELQSLTVADLKCFLSAKKAKVGGKKEELIQRITGILA